MDITSKPGTMSDDQWTPFFESSQKWTSTIIIICLKTE